MMTAAQQCECTQCLCAHLKSAPRNTHTPYPHLQWKYFIALRGREASQSLCKSTKNREQGDTHVGRAACLPVAESLKSDTFLGTVGRKQSRC